MQFASQFLIDRLGGSIEVVTRAQIQVNLSLMIYIHFLSQLIYICVSQPAVGNPISGYETLIESLKLHTVMFLFYTCLYSDRGFARQRYWPHLVDGSEGLRNIYLYEVYCTFTQSTMWIMMCREKRDRWHFKSMFSSIW